MKRSSLLWAPILAGAACVAWAVPMAQRELDLVMTRNPDVQRGAEIYATCATCHGSGGEGAGDGSVPALAGQSYTVIAKQIVDFRAGIRSDLRMKHFTEGRYLAFSQPIADVSKYIAKLPPPKAKAAPPGVSIEQGKVIYDRLCARCHYSAGQGNEDTLAPRLASQHSEYLLMQLNAAATGARPTLVPSHAGLVKGLSGAELKATAGYLSTLSLLSP